MIFVSATVPANICGVVMMILIVINGHKTTPGRPVDVESQIHLSRFRMP